MKSFGGTNTGSKRRWNEDAFMLDEPLQLFLVADGVGDTDTAPMILECIKSYLRETARSSDGWPLRVPHDRLIAQQLSSAIRLANEKVREQQTMGATMAGLWLRRETAFVAHVGDCRVYRWRSEALEQLTEDHTLENEYLQMGKLKEDHVENFPHKRVVTRAVGASHNLRVDPTVHQTKPGDLYLLCTDGLYNDLKEGQMKQILQTTSSLEIACDELLRAADENRGSDNATVLLVRV